MVEWLFLAVPWGCLRFVIVVFPDHTHSLFFCFTNLRSKLCLSGPTLVSQEASATIQNLAVQVHFIQLDGEL